LGLSRTGQANQQRGNGRLGTILVSGFHGGRPLLNICSLAMQGFTLVTAR